MITKEVLYVFSYEAHMESLVFARLSLQALLFDVGL